MMKKKGRPRAFFVKGDKVEVSSDDDGFAGAWFEATVVRSGKRVSVDYDSFVDDNDHSKPLRELVDAAHVRPRPPPDDPLLELGPGDLVEARYNDGWWTGEISEALEDSKFVVKFSGSEDEAFGRSQLRVRRDWVGARWVLPVKQVKTESEFEGTEVTTEPENRKMKHEETMTEFAPEHLIGMGETERKFCKGMQVEVSTDDEGFIGSWFEGTIIEVYGKDKFLVEYKSLRTEDYSQPLRETVDFNHIRPVPPVVFKMEKFHRLEEVDVMYNDGWWVGVISKVLKEARYIVYFRTTRDEMVFRHSELRPHFDWCDGKWIQASQALKFI